MAQDPRSLPDETDELLGLLIAEEGGPAGPRLERRQAGAPPAMSPAQRRLWVLQQLEPASPAYNLSAAVQLRGRLDVGALEGALNDLLERHEVLRTAFSEEDGRAVPRLWVDAAVRISWRDFSELPAAERPAAASRVQAEEAARPFDLAKAPLVRLHVVRLSDEEHRAVLVMHHIVSDAWSMDVLVRELGLAYSARTEGRAPSWAELPLQYADFAAWQQALLDSGVRRTQLDYWSRQLADLQDLELPTDRTRTAVPDGACGTQTFALAPATVAGVRLLAGEEKATVFMVLLAAWQALLHRYTGQDDIGVGAPVANRTRSELEPLIGFFVNTVVLRAKFSGVTSFRMLLRQVRGTALAAYANQDVPFEDVVAALRPNRAGEGMPLFRVMFSVQSVARETLRMPGLELAPLATESAVAKFDLMLAFEEGPDGIVCACEFRRALFNPATIQRMAGHFNRLLAGAVCTPDLPVGELKLMDEAEEKIVLRDWNATGRSYPQAGIAALFAEQAAAHPEAVAVRCAGVELTYGELDARANRLAHALRARGVAVDTLVAVCMERSLDLIVALLGIAKAGGAYLALDPEYPAARLALLLDDARGPVVVTQASFAGLLAEADPAVRLLCVDRDSAELGAQPSCDPGVAVRPEHLAYVSYTSGSTGRPKGVAVPQRGVVRLVRNTDFAELGPRESFLQLAPVAFDASTLEIWAPLLNGGRLIIAPPGPPTMEDLGRWLSEERITTLWMTTGLFHLMVDEQLAALGGLRQLITGGDVPSLGHVRWLLQAHPLVRLINGYGPTENTTFTSCQRLFEADLASGTVPMGRPIANTQVYVLDPGGRPVPIGVPGEIYAGGDGLARGYLNNPALTAEKFVANPFGPGRLYRTGDKARWRADGTLEFLGRLDKQVKIRGYRIEPAEVEAALRVEPGVAAAAVVVHESEGRKQLVGYVAGAVRSGELRASLASRLPAHLVPTAIVVLNSLPLNQNGKLDRSALPAPDLSAAMETAMATDAERAVADAWCSVLGLQRVGRDDNYFAAGGDSITAIQVVSRLRKAGWLAAVNDLFRWPTVAELAARLRPDTDNGTLDHVASVAGPLPLTPAQAWFLARHRTDRHHFNQAVLLRSGRRLDSDALAAVIRRLWEHHDALRTVFSVEGDTPTASLGVPGPAPVYEEVDLGAVPDPERARLAHSERVQGAFDLATGPLFRAVLYRMPAGDRLLLAAHHLVVDAVSWRVLLEDLEAGLRQVARREPLDFGPKPYPLRRWVATAAAMAGGGALEADRTWWDRQGEAAAVWPPRGPVAAGTFGGARTVEASLDEATTRDLLTRAHAAYHTEINDLLLTALARAVGRRQGAGAVHITLEGHGREELGSGPIPDRTVGWFTSLFPVALPPADAGSGIGRHIKQVKEALRGVPRKGVTFGLLAWLGPREHRLSLEGKTRPNLSFNYLGQFGGESGGQLAFADESPGALFSPRVERQHVIDISAAVVGGRLGLSVMYNPECVRPDEAEGFLEDLRAELAAVAAHCVERQAGEKTPADFTSQGLALADFEALLSERRWEAAAIDDMCRLTPMQAGLLFENVANARSRAYCVQLSFRVRGPLDPAAWMASWGDLSSRHCALRTTLVHAGVTAPWQVVWRERPPERKIVDLRGLGAEAQSLRVAEWRADELARGFDLERDALVRVGLLRTGDEQFQVVWSFHHVLLDGWSLGVVHRDLLRCYAARVRGRPPQLPAPADFREFIRWLETRDTAAAKAFWGRYLGGYETTAAVPRQEPAEDATPEGGGHVCELGPELSGALRAVAARAGVTLATVFQCAWAVVLARYNRTEDVVFGGIVAGRPAELAGVEEMVGLFVCAVPVRVRPRNGECFAKLLREVQASAREAEAHQHLPIFEIQALTPLGGSLFEHLVTVENYPIDRELALSGGGGGAGWTIEDIEAHDRTHYAFDLTVHLGESCVLRIQHNRRVHGDAWVAAIAGHVRTVLEQVAADPERPIGRLALAMPDGLSGPLRDWQGPVRPGPMSGEWFHEAVAAQARRTPDAPAVEAAEGSLSYAELDTRANRLANWLRERGIGPEVVVGVAIGRRPALVVALLAISKAGGAYLPLDLQLPAERLVGMVSDSGARLVLGDGDGGTFAGVEKVGVDALRLDGQPATAPGVPLAGANLAYVIFTSGSTGRPKGSAITHAGLRNYIRWAAEAYGAGEGTVSPLHTTIAFDLTVTSLWVPLAAGGCVRLSPETPGLAEALDAAGAAERLRPVKLTPAHMDLLNADAMADRRRVELMVVGGEQLYARQAGPWVRAGTRVVNEYGPTETVVGCTVREVEAGDLANGAIPIGRPLANMRNYVLDGQLNPLPPGVAGELYIGGVQVARGYIGRPDLTAERFVPDPLSNEPGARLYRTGDLVRWRADGQLEFLGRIDQQVKVRGYRIELGEIESALSGQAGVQACAVAVVDEQLVGYVAPQDAPGREALRTLLRTRLPDYMVPEAYVYLAALPLTANGKVDRRALPAPGRAGSVARTPPRNATEAALAGIWREVLQIPEVGVHDNFFELGGHSLKAMQVASRAQQALGVRPDLRAFVRAPTIADLAAQLGAAETAPVEEIPKAPQREHYDLSYAQQRLWLLHRLGGEAAYNMPEAHLLESVFDADSLETAFRLLVARHEALRTEYIEVDGEPRQRILPAVEFTLGRVNLAGEPDAEARARALADAEAAAPFDLARPPLLRATVIALGPRRTVLLFTMHHIVGDGWSGNVLYREVLALYAAVRSGAADPLPPLRIQYKDFAVWQKSRGFGRAEAFWLAKLSGTSGAVELPYDRAPGGGRDFRGSTERAEIDAATAAALARLAVARQTTLANVVLAVFDLVLFQLTRQEDLCVGVSVANRGHPDLERLIGFFVNLLPVRVRLNSAMEFDDLLREVSLAAAEAFEHQEYPFDLLVQKLNPARAGNRQPLVNVVYAFQNFSDVHLSVGAAAGGSPADAASAAELVPAGPFEHDFKTSKFDLTLFVFADAGRLLLTLEYDTGLFRADTIRRYLGLLRRFAGQVALSAPAAPPSA